MSRNCALYTRFLSKERASTLKLLLLDYYHNRFTIIVYFQAFVRVKWWVKKNVEIILSLIRSLLHVFWLLSYSSYFRVYLMFHEWYPINRMFWSCSVRRFYVISLSDWRMSSMCTDQQLNSGLIALISLLSTKQLSSIDSW